MKAIAVNFAASGARIDWNAEVTDFNATAQAALINYVTPKAAGERMLTDRGTDLLARAATGRLISQRSALHAANFAALDTVFFINRRGPESLGEKLQTIRPVVVSMDTRVLKLSLELTSTQGTVVGINPVVSLDA